MIGNVDEMEEMETMDISLKTFSEPMMLLGISTIVEAKMENPCVEFIIHRLGLQ